MIVVKLEGGHSNQLFQYAAGRRLALKLGVELLMDLSWFNSIAQGDTQRIYELGEYKIKQNFITNDKFALAKDEPENIKVKLYKITKGRRKPRFIQYREKNHSFDKDVLKLPDNIYLDGFWQNEKYFKDIRPTLLNELELQRPPSAKNGTLLKQIKTSNSVSVHIRRGDYVTNTATNKFHGVMSLDYYRSALNLLKEKNSSKDLHLFIFSNDIGWCKQNIKLGGQTTFVEGNKKGAEDMRLMKHCKHNILANSSFSWWGAWLNENPDKIVIAPKIWFQDKKANEETEIVPDSWIRI